MVAFNYKVISKTTVIQLIFQIRYVICPCGYLLVKASNFLFYPKVEVSDIWNKIAATYSSNFKEICVCIHTHTFILERTSLRTQAVLIRNYPYLYCSTDTRDKTLQNVHFSTIMKDQMMCTKTHCTGGNGIQIEV